MKRGRLLLVPVAYPDDCVDLKSWKHLPLVAYDKRVMVYLRCCYNNCIIGTIFASGSISLTDSNLFFLSDIIILSKEKHGDFKQYHQWFVRLCTRIIIILHHSYHILDTYFCIQDKAYI